MRDYAKCSPGFWTGETAKLMRRLGRDAQVIGFYLFTAPTANMLGLYYLPLPTLCHEVGGITPEGASKVLRSLSEGGYAHYDEHSEHVWVVGMALHQIGERLTRKDNRHKALLKILEQFRKTPFFNDFVTRYAAAFDLSDVELNEPLPRGFKGPSKPLRSQEQEQEQEKEQEKRVSAESASPSPAPALRIPKASLPKPFIEIADNTGQPWAVYAEMVEEWRGLFPAVDVEQTLRGIKAWADANPRKRKTAAGMKRFIVAWLGRDQDRGGARGDVPRGTNGSVLHTPAPASDMPTLDLERAGL